MDITDDRLYTTLMDVCGDGGAPDYVLDAGPLGKEAAERLPDSLFADRVNRRYPIDSKADTWLSAAYFAKTAGDDGYSSDTVRRLVGDTILAAAGKYGIRKDAEEVMARLSAGPAEKRAEDDESNYGWPAERKYPMFDAHGVKLACSYFAENRFMYPAGMRREIASRIMAKCAEHGVEPSDAVRVESGNGFNLVEDAGAELLDRVSAANRVSPEAAAALAKAASALVSLPPAKYAASADELGRIVEGLDEELGFADGYGTRFRSPMEIFHARNTKEASDFLGDTVDLGGDLFSVTKLAGLPLGLFTGALGDGFGDSVKSVKVVRITKKTPHGVARITISGGMPDFIDGGFGLDSDFPPCDGPCGAEGGEGEEDGEVAEDTEDTEGGEGGKDTVTIDVKKLGKALNALPEEDRNALRKAIELYMD